MQTFTSNFLRYVRFLFGIFFGETHNLELKKKKIGLLKT